MKRLFFALVIALAAPALADSDLPPARWANEQLPDARQEAQAKANTEIAKAEKEKSAAALNFARANKFAVETETDPDAAYERVEQERIASERADADRNFALEVAKFEEEKKRNTQEMAIELTKLDVQRETARESNEAKKAQAKQQPKGKSKPPAKK